MSLPENAWDRWPDEDPKWFERFDVYYRSLGPSRSLTAAYNIYYKEVNGKLPDRPGAAPAWYTMADKWEWKRRAEAWDAHLRKQKLREEEASEVEMHREHIKMAQAVRNLAFAKMLEDGFKDGATALRAWRQAIQVEKSARGIPDYLTEISEMDEDELNAELAKALRSAGAIGRNESKSEAEGETSS